MSRPLRINYPNAWYHVMNRGAGRKNIFKNKTHRIMFLELLKECRMMFNIKICAYCLMDNHYHLLLSTPEANLSRVMSHLNGVYTLRYNRSLKIDGALFKGRYRAQLIEEDSYQLFVSRYIHLNPVAAGLVANAADYEWSSYAAYLGLAETPEWLSKEIILEQISSIHSLSHIQNYQDYVERNIEEINTFSSIKFTSPILGSNVFKERILLQIEEPFASVCSPDINRAKSVPSINIIIKYVCNYYNIKQDALIHTKRGILNWPKLVYIYIARKRFGHSLKEISQSLDIHPVTISSTMQKCIQRINNNPILVNEINFIYESIKNSMD